MASCEAVSTSTLVDVGRDRASRASAGADIMEPRVLDRARVVRVVDDSEDRSGLVSEEGGRLTLGPAK